MIGIAAARNRPVLVSIPQLVGGGAVGLAIGDSISITKRSRLVAKPWPRRTSSSSRLLPSPRKSTMARSSYTRVTESGRPGRASILTLSKAKRWYASIWMTNLERAWRQERENAQVQQAVDRGLPKTKLTGIPFRMEMSGFARLEGSLPVTADIGLAWPVLASHLENLLELDLNFISAPQETPEGKEMRDWIVDSVQPVDRSRMHDCRPGRGPMSTPASERCSSGRSHRTTSGVWSRMLWFCGFFNYADRQAIFSVFPLLQAEMHLDKVQLGLLGSSFALVYGICAPFAGNIVDRIRRKTAVLGGLWAWSIICMLTALATNFKQLLFFRAAEGLGETFYFPASMSMISDYHGKKSRSRAMGFHQTSVYIGTIAGGFFGGLISQFYGWRWSFIVFGGMGVLLGFVLTKFLVEPERGAADLEDFQVRKHQEHRMSVERVSQGDLDHSHRTALHGRFHARQLRRYGAAELDAGVPL